MCGSTPEEPHRDKLMTTMLQHRRPDHLTEQTFCVILWSFVLSAESHVVERRMSPDEIKRYGPGEIARLRAVAQREEQDAAKTVAEADQQLAAALIKKNAATTTQELEAAEQDRKDAQILKDESSKCRDFAIQRMTMTYNEMEVFQAACLPAYKHLCGIHGALHMGNVLEKRAQHLWEEMTRDKTTVSERDVLHQPCVTNETCEPVVNSPEPLTREPRGPVAGVFRQPPTGVLMTARRRQGSNWAPYPSRQLPVNGTPLQASARSLGESTRLSQ